MRRQRTRSTAGRRRDVTVLSAIAALAAACDAGPGMAMGDASAVGSADLAEMVRVVGRVHVLDDGGYAFAWSGTAFEMTFEGARLDAIIDESGDTWLDVTVDGETRAIALEPGRRRYAIVDTTPGLHRVRIARRTEAYSGVTVLAAIEADGPVAPTAPPERRILVIGDSITTGYGVEGDRPNCSYSRATQNVAKSYAGLTADALGSDLHVVAISGRGVVRNYDDAGGAPMADAYGLVFPGGEVWESVRYQPQVVVINLGVNDFAGNDPGPAFVARYDALLGELEERYPSARLYATIGPVTDETERELADAAIQEAVARHSAAGGREASFISFEWAAAGRVYGCDWHPGADTHARMAQTLLDRLETDLGWAASGGVASAHE